MRALDRQADPLVGSGQEVRQMLRRLAFPLVGLLLSACDVSITLEEPATPTRPIEFCGESWGPDTTYLTCAREGVSDLSPLSGLTGLTELNLWNTQVTDLRPLSGLTGLATLYLHHTPVTDLSRA